MAALSLVMNVALKNYLEEVEAIEFFGSVGCDLPDDISRIGEWDEWPGPEDERVSSIHYSQQDLHDKLVGAAEDEQAYWNKLLRYGVERAKRNIPFIEGEDAWYAPNIAAWHAAWTFSLMALLILNEQEPPKDIAVQWEWFKKGHWPCSVHSKEDGKTNYVIY